MLFQCQKLLKNRKCLNFLCFYRVPRGRALNRVINVTITPITPGPKTRFDTEAWIGVLSLYADNVIALIAQEVVGSSYLMTLIFITKFSEFSENIWEKLQ